jgi:hypothetical protein
MHNNNMYAQKLHYYELWRCFTSQWSLVEQLIASSSASQQPTALDGPLRADDRPHKCHYYCF